jgi:hypothetical protein
MAAWTPTTQAAAISPRISFFPKSASTLSSLGDMEKTCIGTKRPMHDNFMKKQRVILPAEELVSRHGCMGRNVTAPSMEMNARPWFWPHENGNLEKTIKKGGLRLL